jgi:mono/diheme cytochrome c family protein
VSSVEGDSPVAGYLGDPQAMGRASQLFRAVCTGYCHSTQTGADRVAPNLFDCDWTHGSTDQEIYRAIYDGIPDSQMQAFGERLPDEDLWKLVAYLRQRSTCK